MKKLFYIFIFFSVFGFSQSKGQNTFSTRLIDSTQLHAKTIFGVDNFKTLYYSTDNNSFHKKTKDTTITYSNFQLGEITSANTFNPLKMNLFYKDFNTVIILDNRLAEISKIDFNLTQPYRNVSFISMGYHNTLWLFNQDYNYLELYDYKAQKTKLKTVPIPSNVLDLKSDYNYCYLLTERFLYVYNYFGSLIHKLPNLEYERLAFSEAHLVLKSKDKLYILKKNDNSIYPLEQPNLLIKQFLVTNETLYLYHENVLRHYQLKIN
ncbi:hypothetical protein [Winogradskyella arenosi]|uniref:Uncharacterized protein n=1 Tax=Winogradskyella arenosi TaxID=533325 RepID=A0A368ZJU5_9FLAO|nr:hypothetical protein [Winogradskyella arenosi]RCW94040.1 hypothetical protein DFQ08_101843 [Winogradskyella arenosi]